MMAVPWSPIAYVYDPVTIGSIDGTDEEPHDHGIVRAANAKYRPNLEVVGNPDCTIFVARLNHSTTEETLQKLFSTFGQVKRLRLVRDIVTGFSKGYAFIEYFDESDVERAYHDANKVQVDDCQILVDYVFARSMEGWVPRRLGGGFAGKKESGQLRFGCRDRPFRKPIFLPEGQYFEPNKEGDHLSGRRMNRETSYTAERSTSTKYHDAEEESAKELSAEYHRVRRSDDSRRREIRKDRLRVEPKIEPDCKSFDKAVIGMTRSDDCVEASGDHGTVAVKREPDVESRTEHNDEDSRRNRTTRKNNSSERSRSRVRSRSRNRDR